MEYLSGWSPPFYFVYFSEMIQRLNDDHRGQQSWTVWRVSDEGADSEWESNRKDPSPRPSEARIVITRAVRHSSRRSCATVNSAGFPGQPRFCPVLTISAVPPLAPERNPPSPPHAVYVLPKHYTLAISAKETTKPSQTSKAPHQSLVSWSSDSSTHCDCGFSKANFVGTF